MSEPMTLDVVRSGLQKLFDVGAGAACNAFPLAQWIQSIDAAISERNKLRAMVSALPADWRVDSSLETWFPITAGQFKRLTSERDALRTRIESAPAGVVQEAGVTLSEWVIVESDMPDAADYIGKRVHLVVEG